MKLELEFQSPELSASREFTAYGKNAADASELLQSGIGYAKEGDREAARHFLLRAVDAEPENEDAWLWLASTSHYPEELLVFLQNVLKINPANERALEWQKATKALLAESLVERGASASEQNQKEYANQCFVHALLHDNQNETAWLWLASNSESAEEKISHFQKVLNINPANESALASLKSLKHEMSQSLLKKANFAAISGERQQARELLDGAMENAPEMEEVWILKAYLTDDSEGKIACYEKILALNPENEMAQAGLASLKDLLQKSNEQKSNAESLQEVFAANSASFSHAAEATGYLEEAREFHSGQEAESFDLSDEADGNPSPASAQEYAFETRAAHNYTPQPFEQPTDELDVSFIDEVESRVDFAEEQPLELDEDDCYSIADYQSVSAENEFQVSTLPDQIELFVESAEAGVEKEEMSADSFFEQIDYLEEINACPEVQILEENEADEIVNQESQETSEFDDELANSYNRANDEPVRLEETLLPNPVESPAQSDSNTVSYEAEPLKQNAQVLTQDNSEDLESDGANSGHLSSENKSFSDNQTMLSNDWLKNEDTESLAYKTASSTESSACPFCYVTNEAQAFVCGSCKIMFSLSDLEMLLSHTEAQVDVLEMAIEDLESERASRGLNESELVNLGIAHLNAKNLRKGLNCLQEAAQMNPNDIVLGSKVNFLAIRLSEIEAHESKMEGASVRQLTIMVVDDSVTVRKLISGKLEKSGHTVVAAADGAEALAKIKEVQPDLILLDIMMPQMGGYQVCKLIRSHTPTKDVPVIMISGKDGFFDKVRGRMAGTTGYITKPFGPETLMRTIESYVV